MREQLQRHGRLRESRAAAPAPLTEVASGRFARWLTARSPTSWLIADALPIAYRTHFRAKIGYTTKEVEDEFGDYQTTSDSPFVRFVEAVLHEYGIRTSKGSEYKRTTIARELNHATNGRSRRRAA